MPILAASEREDLVFFMIDTPTTVNCAGLPAPRHTLHYNTQRYSGFQLSIPQKKWRGTKAKTGEMAKGLPKAGVA